MPTEVLENRKSPSILMVKRGFAVALPIMLGYLPVALTYGVLAKQAGLSLLELASMSAFVYAGAAQFMGLNMIMLGSSAIEIVIATFVLNFRHFVMGLSFMNQLRRFSLRWKVPLSLGLTDESFAVSAVHKQEAKEEKGIYFYATIFLLAYLSWFAGSIVGGLLGEIIPETLSQSMGIALYAMFIGLLIPSVKSNHKVGYIAVIAMLVNAICMQLGMSSGWAIVVGTIVGGASGIFFLRGENE